MPREALIAVTVWKFRINYNLKLSPVRELAFSRFLTIIKTNVKINIQQFYSDQSDQLGSEKGT